MPGILILGHSRLNHVATHVPSFVDQILWLNIPFLHAAQMGWTLLISEQPSRFPGGHIWINFNFWLLEQKKGFHLNFFQVCDDEGCHERHMPAEFYAVSHLKNYFSFWKAINKDVCRTELKSLISWKRQRRQIWFTLDLWQNNTSLE